MKGNIYSDQKCEICGSRLNFSVKGGLCCPNHKMVRATRFKVIFGKKTKRFKDFFTAERFLNGLRFKEDEGTFDIRDYMEKDNPLLFSKLVQEWLNQKKPKMKPGGWQSIKALMAHTERAWANTYIKNLGYAEVEDLLNGLELSSKTKHNLLATLKQFWKWVVRRHKIDPIEDWPEIGTVVMKYRKLVNLEDQEAIIQNIKEHESQWRIWLCIKWLATYSDCRPGEMLSLKEGDIDRAQGLITIKGDATKEHREDVIPLTREDWGLIKSLPLNFDQDAFFFRHDGSRGHAEAGKPFSRKMLWAAWKRACSRLGIEGVDLYGGTKHSTLTGLRTRGCVTYEEARKMSGHTTNKAFDRYLKLEAAPMRELYARRSDSLTNTDKELTSIKGISELS